MEAIPTPSNSSGARSTFLTVICVLTFIGSGWGIISAIRSYASADKMAAIVAEKMSGIEDKIDVENVPGFVKSIFKSLDSVSPDWIRKSAIVKLLSHILTLIGAVLMWNTGKSGFYIYIAGIVVLILSPLVLGKTGFTGAESGAFIGVIFIVLYGLNLKQLNSN
jgi:hypothetical protein